MKLLQRLMGKPKAKAPGPQGAPGPVFDAPIAPDTNFFVIGDIHGCLQKLADLLMQIEQLEDVPRVIVVGDMVDRGEHSAGVLNLLKRLNGEFGDLVTCLKGNHESMLLRFIDDPEATGDRWMRNGGLQTLASYKVNKLQGTTHTDLRDQLVQAMGIEMIDWLIALPLMWQSGNVAVVHAGADPKLPLDAQADEILMWGHGDFQRIDRSDGIWIVHGHTIVRQARSENGRISIDTGAYATGRLTAAYIRPGQVSFLSS